ncbi:MAG TPA: enoyl-CoA hydratase/isomerase family protein [Burkholderiales bacterium]|nr:enoyl-CoA hydratase/isomerase family protein [Burkholderiales bacterium]
MADDALIAAREDGVTRLTLNRAQKANALSAALVEALLEAFERAASDGTRLIVLEGAGPHFCAGFDFTDYESASDGDLALRFVRIETLLQAIHHSPCETLALAHGRVFGAGADIVASCSRRIAAPDAAFLMPGLRFGVVLGTRRLAARVGGDAARDILSTSRSFDAQEALRIGFLTRIAPREQWPDLVAAARGESAKLSPAASAALGVATLRDTRAEDMAALARSVSVPGLKERIRAFREGQARRPAR